MDLLDSLVFLHILINWSHKFEFLAFSCFFSHPLNFLMVWLEQIDFGNVYKILIYAAAESSSKSPIQIQIQIQIHINIPSNWKCLQEPPHLRQRRLLWNPVNTNGEALWCLTLHLIGTKYKFNYISCVFPPLLSKPVVLRTCECFFHRRQCRRARWPGWGWGRAWRRRCCRRENEQEKWEKSSWKISTLHHFCSSVAPNTTSSSSISVKQL